MPPTPLKVDDSSRINISLTCLSACLLACLFACLFIFLLVCSLACFLACLPACLLACLLCLLCTSHIQSALVAARSVLTQNGQTLILDRTNSLDQTETLVQIERFLHRAMASLFGAPPLFLKFAIWNKIGSWTKR